MVFDLQILNEDASLNSFHSIGSLRFNPGDPFTIICRAIQPDKHNIRYSPATGATFSLTLTKSDGTTTVVKAGTQPFAGDDDSILSFAFTAGESTGMIGQNLTVSITEGAVVHAAILKNGLQSTAAEC